jgi:hypothetical protein
MAIALAREPRPFRVFCFLKKKQEPAFELVGKPTLPSIPGATVCMPSRRPNKPRSPNGKGQRQKEACRR